MSISEAIRSDSRAISAAEKSARCFKSARAAARAYVPPEPIARTPSSGEIRSPVPEMSSDVVLSATINRASSWRSILSVRQSLASSIAERSRLPRNSSSFISNREKSANASAEDPANPAITSPPFNLRIFAAVCFMTVVPSVTWPSETIATFPPWRTQRTVVACHFSIPERIPQRRLWLGRCPARECLHGRLDDRILLSLGGRRAIRDRHVRHHALPLVAPAVETLDRAGGVPEGRAVREPRRR